MSGPGDENHLPLGTRLASISGAEQSSKLTSIAACYQSCIRGFLCLKNILCTPPAKAMMSAEQLQRIQVTLREQVGRFKLWAGNAGAHRRGKTSLDYRMREALHIHRQVVQLLEDMEHALEEGQATKP